MTPMLEVDRLAKRFGGVPAIQDLSFAVPAGECCGLIGPNGAGKTTLMNLITGYLRPDSGTIRVSGQSTSGLRPYRVCHLGVARTFQIVRPFAEMSVHDNVLTGALFSGRKQDAAPEAHCAELLDLVGLSAKRDLRAGTLTLGEKKRLELARSLASHPKLLLLDEVMGGLSDGELRHMVEVLRRVHRSGTTIVMIEHVLRALVQIVDRLVVLHFGRKVADGTPDEVLSHPEVIEAYLGTPGKRQQAPA